ncbi:hypothetical protein U1Q18_000405 [Sarracenia purpurea var. burkii]
MPELRRSSKKIRAAMALWVKEYIGYEAIEKQEKNYIEKALERLLPNQNIWILGEYERQATSDLVVPHLLHCPFFIGRDRLQWSEARISFPYYMSKEEFEFILAVVEFTSTYAQRFLPLYHFNWRTGAWTFKKRALKEKTPQAKEHNCDFCCSSMAASLT